MLTQSPEEIFLRFERPKSVWFELAYVESCQRFLGFRCNAFEEDPDWQLIYAATLPEAKRAISNWLKLVPHYDAANRDIYAALADHLRNAKAAARFLEYFFSRAPEVYQANGFAKPARI